MVWQQRCEIYAVLQCCTLLSNTRVVANWKISSPGGTTFLMVNGKGLKKLFLSL